MAGTGAAQVIAEVRRNDGSRRKKLLWIWAAAALACLVLLSRRKATDRDDRDPYTPVEPRTRDVSEPKWTDPRDDGSCPESHPVKAKASSGIYHVPGGALYARTRPDRCYCDEEAAQADGFRPSKV